MRIASPWTGGEGQTCGPLKDLKCSKSTPDAHVSLNPYHHEPAGKKYRVRQTDRQREGRRKRKKKKKKKGKKEIIVRRCLLKSSKHPALGMRAHVRHV